MAEKPAPPISTAGAGVLLLALLLAGYVGSFWFTTQSRRCMMHDPGVESYYFADPISPLGSKWHLLLCCFYFPLIEIDKRWISGQRPAELSGPLLYFDNVQPDPTTR